ASWYATVWNVDKNIEYGAVIITQRHVITVKQAVTKIVNGEEIVTDNYNLQVIPIIRKYGEKSTVYKVQRTLIPVRLRDEFEKPVLLNLVIVQVDPDFHENVTYACLTSNGRYPHPPFEYIARRFKIHIIT
ncbi:hypothetical protein PMAYCL1PPCAC_19866, partial [Pristionchus mayeri]